MQKIADRHGILLQSVYQVLKAEGVPRERPRGRPPTEQQKLMAEDYRAGIPVKEIAQKHGVSEWSVGNAARRCGEPARRAPNHQWSKEDAQAIARRWRDGESQEEIAKDYGVRREDVRTLMRKHKVRLPHHHNKARGEQHGMWKGGRITDHGGYILVKVTPEDPAFPMANNQGYVREHRLVMSRVIGRLLLPTETVHHKDGNRKNNHPDNLQLRQGSHGSGVVMTCLDCGSHSIEALEV